MSNLTKYDIAFIGIRLLTIYILLQIIAALPMSFSMVFFQEYSFIYKLLMGGALLVFLLIPVWLWILSDKIAKCIVVSPSSTHTESANLQDLEGILFAAIGVFVFVTTIPTFIVGAYVLIHTYIQTQHVDGWQGLFNTRLTADFLKLMISVILVFKAQGLSKLMNKLKYAGFKNS